MEEFDEAVLTLNYSLKANVLHLIAAQNLKSKEVENYIWHYKPTSIDVYQFLAADETLTNCSDITTLFKISLLITLLSQI